MCVACHYKGNNKLVFAEDKIKVHGVPTCYYEIKEGEYECIDCSEIIIIWQVHCCAGLWQINGVSSTHWIDKPCKGCGAPIGEKCRTRGFDKYGPKKPVLKRVPCAARNRDE